MTKTVVVTCCICGADIKSEHGWDGTHNPWPIDHEDGERCCERCNNELVVPVRIKMHYLRKQQRP